MSHGEHPIYRGASLFFKTSLEFAYKKLRQWSQSQEHSTGVHFVSRISQHDASIVFAANSQAIVYGITSLWNSFQKKAYPKAYLRVETQCVRILLHSGNMTGVKCEISGTYQKLYAILLISLYNSIYQNRSIYLAFFPHISKKEISRKPVLESFSANEEWYLNKQKIQSHMEKL